MKIYLNKVINFIFYLAIALLSFDEINFFGVNYAHAPSLYLFLVYFIIRLPSVKKLKMEKKDSAYFLMIILLFLKCLIECFRGNGTIYLTSYINAYLLSCCIYFSIKLFFALEGTSSFNKAIRVVFWSTSIIGIIQGCAQIIYIYLFKNPIVYQIIYSTHGEFAMNHLNAGRVSLQFTEPSAVGTGIILLVIIPYLYLKRYCIDKKMDIVVIVVLCLSFFSLSATSLYMYGIMLIIYILFYKDRGNNSNKKLLYIGLLSAGILIISYTSFNEKINGYIQRFTMLLNGTYSGDSSIVTRITLLLTGFLGFVKHPIWGYGVMRFGNACIENIYHALRILKVKGNIELYSYTIPNSILYAHSFYFTQLAENGILGIMYILSVLRMLLSKHRNQIQNIIGLFLAFAFIQLEIVAPYIIFTLAIATTTKCIQE